MTGCRALTLPHATLYAGTPQRRAPHEHLQLEVIWRFGHGSRKLPSAWIVPPGVPHASKGDPERLSVVLQLAPDLLELTAMDLLRTPQVQFQGGPTSDPVLRYIGMTMASELEVEWRETFLLDAFAHVVAAHLVRRYCLTPIVATPARAPRRLSAAELMHLRSFLHDRLDDAPTVSEMAGALGLSVTRLGAALKAATGLGPHGYLMHLRLERARVLLRESNQPLAEVALALGFCSQSHFTAVFNRRVGTTPGAYRAQVRGSRLFPTAPAKPLKDGTVD